MEYAREKNSYYIKLPFLKTSDIEYSLYINKDAVKL